MRKEQPHLQSIRSDENRRIGARAIGVACDPQEISSGKDGACNDLPDF